MDWTAFKRGFDDELQKISEVNLTGLSAETLLSYPKPEPMPSAAYEKAQAILAKVQPLGTEKTSAIRPDRMEPGYDAVLSDKKKQTKSEVKSVGAHVLGGAGAGKFLHDWVDTGRMAFTKPKINVPYLRPQGPKPASPRAKFLAITSGALIGAGEYGRKRLKKHQADKKKKQPNP
jgi:hypothetical protein